MAGVICLASISLRLCMILLGFGGSPTEHRTNEYPAEVALVVQRVEVLRHHVSPVWVDVVVRPFGDGCRSWELHHLFSIHNANE